MVFGNKTVAVVTGGASGLGAATVQKLVAMGVKVAIFDINVAAGQVIAKNLNGSFHQVDVSNSESVATGLEQVVNLHGTPQIMVNCAGIAPAAKTVSRGLLMMKLCSQKLSKSIL